jgi:1-acyl-sn-glycerol-3-phosphate acyltransferase
MCALSFEAARRICMSLDTHAIRPNPSWIVRLFRPVAYAWMKANRFRVLGVMPDLPKYVIVGAPHRTNWDLPHALAAGLHYGLRINWMGKATIFKWPFGGLMRWLGGVSVDRSKSNNAVSAMIDVFKSHDQFHLVIPPEGTRKHVEKWKSGFYHIAVGAGVPIVLVYIDYKRRQIGIAEVFHPSGDYDTDIEKIYAIYKECAEGKR